MKITKGLYLRICFRGNLIERCFLETSGSKPSDEDSPIYRKFLPYVRGEGDVRIGMDELCLEGYPGEVIEVYRVLKEKVSFGKRITYGELGKLVGKHPRFVAYCMRINKFPILIPCHRVISKDGLGGFSYGIRIKRALLSFEEASGDVTGKPVELRDDILVSS